MKFPRINIETRIALLYLLFGGLWILLSDRLLAALIQNQARLTDFQTYKGWGFVFVSATLVFLLLRNSLSNQRRAEEELRQVNERYRLLFDTSLDAIFLTAPDGSIFAANPAACRIFDRPEEEIKQVGRNGVVDGSDPRLQAALEERARTGKFIGELSFVRKDGSKFPGEISTAMFKDQQGRSRASMIIRDVTERRHTEQALRESEKNLHLLFDHMLEAVAYHEILFENSRAVDYIYLEVNDTFGRLTGLKNVVGRRVSEIVPGIHETNPELIERFGRVALTGQPEQYEAYIAASKTWFFTSVYYLAKDTVVCVFDNITERKRAEEELRESEERYRNLLEVAPIGIAVHAGGKIVFINSAGAHMLGAESGEQIVGKPIVEIIHPDGLNKAQTRIQRMMAGEQGLYPVEDTYLKMDGRPISVEVMATRLLYGGKPAVQVVVTDITERKRTEEALRQSEERLRFAMEGANDGLWDVQMESGSVYMSPRGCEILGYQPDELAEIVRVWSDLVNPDDMPQTQEKLTKYLDGLAPLFEVEQRLRTKSGSWKWVLTRGKAVERDESGSPLRMTGTHTDITARKRVEDELLVSHEQLRLVTARLDELQERERHALAKELHDRVGQSLTALGINLNLIRRRVEPEGPNELTPRFDSALALVTEITDHIREVMAELHPPVLDDYGLAAALRWFAERVKMQTGLQVEIIGELLQPRLPLSTSMILFRIAQEALNNIVKHAGTDQASIFLEGLPDEVVLSISDEGIGFDPSRPYLSADARWGLLTMRERVEAAGGRLLIESAPGAGTTIIARVPR